MVAMLRSYEYMPPTRYLIRLDPEAETLGQMLRRLRDERGWKQEQVAALVDPERADDFRAMKNMQSLLSRYESDTMKRPDTFLLERLEQVYELAPDTLVLAATHTERKSRRQETLFPVRDSDVDAVRRFSRHLVESGEDPDSPSFDEMVRAYVRFLDETGE